MNVIESVDEVRPELQTEPFCQRKVLMHTHIQIGVTRRPQTCELRGAVSEARGGLSEVPIVGEPLSAYAWYRCVLDRRE